MLFNICSLFQFVTYNFHYFSEFSRLYFTPCLYEYDAYFVVSESGCSEFSKPFVEAVEGNGYTLFYELRDMLVGKPIADEITSNLEKSRSLIIMFDNSFFDSAWGIFVIERGLYIKSLLKEHFKLIVVEVEPIPDEYLFQFRSFSRIEIKKPYEKTTYINVMQILNDTGILMIYILPTAEVI